MNVVQAFLLHKNLYKFSKLKTLFDLFIYSIHLFDSFIHSFIHSETYESKNNANVVF